MSEGNGIDIAAVYQLLSEVARTVAGHERRFDAIDRRFDESDRKLNEVITVVNGHTRQLDELALVVNNHDRKLDDLAADLAGLREGLTHYHSSVLGHGILISDLEERVRRIERHLHLDPAGS